MVKHKTETMEFGAEVSKILKLMIHSLYTNKDIFLRELVSNASDACDKLRYEGQQDASLLKDGGDLRITIAMDKEARTITVTDNGIGMDRDDLIANLGTIARSGTQEFMSTLTGDSGRDVELIGQFGVGFYASFIIADRVTVHSRKAGADQAWCWESEGEGAFTVTPLEDGDTPRGTSITLHVREDEEDFLDRFRLQHIVKSYSDHVSIPIFYKDSENTEHQVNSGSALWSRPKSEVTDEQYQEFYKSVSHSPDTPWMTLHNKAEGTIEYNNLLYIPSQRPFDLFHPDRMRRVKLYIKRVFITDEGVDIVPHWLRFLRGVVDSQDLPLNISRETLQHNRVLDKIRRAITSKVLGELKKRAEKDEADYTQFWDNFGPVVKEGLCESMQDKEAILQICRFYSTKSPNAYTNLDEYISRMPESQESIYYIAGEDREALMHSPQLEGFLSRGVEVLLFEDHVDNFWVNLVHEYQGKTIESVTRAVLSDEIVDASDDDAAESEKKEAAAASESKEMEALIVAMKSVLGDEVKEVRTTNKLTRTPVCLAIGEGDMDIRMERFLVESKQLPGTSARILEINPKHAVIKALAAKAEKSGAESVKDTVFLLLDQAKVADGEAIKDPGAFSQRITDLLNITLAAA